MTPTTLADNFIAELDHESEAAGKFEPVVAQSREELIGIFEKSLGEFKTSLAGRTDEQGGME